MRIALSLISLLLLASPALADDFGRQLPVAAGERLQITLERGSVELMRHDDAVVRLVARARGDGADGMSFRLDRDEQGLVFRGSALPWLSWLRVGPRVTVRVWAPRTLDVAIETAGRVERLDPGVRISHPATPAP
jgi:hypothetical protein